MAFEIPNLDDATARVGTMADRVKQRAVAIETQHPRLALVGYFVAGVVAGRLARRGRS